MSPRSKTVSVAVVRQIQERLEKRGVGPSDFLARTGLTSAELADPAARIGRDRFLRVLKLAAALPPSSKPQPDFLEELAHSAPLLVSCWLNAPTLRAALEGYLRFRSLLGESDRVVLSERENTVRLEYIADDPQELAAFQAKGNFDMVMGIVRRYEVGVPTRFRARLSDPASRRDPEFEAALQGPFELDQAVNTLEFEALHLDAGFPQYNPAVACVLGARLSDELARVHGERSLSARVEGVARRLVAATGVGRDPASLLTRVCAEVGVSRWTLHRKLSAERTTFQALWGAVRMHEAHRLLLDTSLSLKEISERVGFQSHSSFSRFFLRETGTSPLRFRRAGAAARNGPEPLAAGRG